MAVRVGIDLVSVETVRASVETHADHYLQRVYTDRELADCRGADGLELHRLAARFAAKEAAMKVLRVREEAVPWRSIEVRRDDAGWAELALSGAAAELAAAAGVRELAVSLTHEREWASAVVIAETAPSDR